MFDVIANAYKEAGTPAVIVTMVAAISSMVLRRAFLSSGIAACVVTLPLLVGVGGYMWGLHRIDNALALVSPEMQAALQEAGRREAMNNIYIGAFWSAILGLIALLSRRVAQ